jgi:4'-phosphopantetheinyl transferase
VSVKADPISWVAAPDDPVPSQNQVHVWRTSLDRPDQQMQYLESLLSPDERTRAERFRFQRDRKRFCVARGVLRVILGRYLRITPGHVQFRYEPSGKPCLAESQSSEGIHFSLAHSGGWTLYAFVLGRRVGIDLEYVRPLPDIELIATSFFSALEQDTLRRLPIDQQCEAFYNAWTRKEAYLKALGCGLSYPLDQFDVSLVPGELACLRGVRGYPEEPSRWSLAAFTPHPRYVAALAVEGQDWRLSCWDI